MNKTNLSKFNNNWYNPGKNFFVRTLWYITNIIFLKNSFNTLNFTKILFLKIFGAKIGKGVIIKPSVNIKYPWRLKIGNNVWIGENAWIDNLADVIIGDNVCISQGALLLCGNHNYKKSTFDLMIANIVIENGVWIGAKAIVNGGVTCRSHSILTLGSIATKNLQAYKIYKGNPAQIIKERKIEQ